METTVLYQVGVIELIKKLRKLGNISDDKYFEHLNQLLEKYQIWPGSFNDIRHKETLLNLLNKLNSFIDGHGLPVELKFDIENINIERFNLKP